MGGYGSTIGGIGGGAIGTVYGGPVGGMLGSTAGSALGGGIEGMFSDSDEPKQTKRQLSTYDPYSHFGNQIGVIEPMLRNRMNTSYASQLSTPGSVGNLYVQPGAQQTGALNAFERYQGMAEPAYGAGIEQLQGTIGGQYLDPMARPEFQRLATARQDIARDQFRDALNRVNAGATLGGIPDSSVRQKQGAEQGRRVGTEAAHDIAQAGWQQYAAERAAQEAATRAGLELAPGLAGKVFQGAEQLRGAEQAAGISQADLNMRGQIAAMQGQLQAMGLDDQSIGRVLQYMQLRGLRGVEPILGPTSEEAATQRNAGMLGMLGGMGGGEGGGMLSDLFKKKTTGGSPSFSTENIGAQNWGYM